MIISCSGLGKRFGRDWIFRDLNYEFSDKHTYAITGPNGSGKSTFLQVLAGLESYHKGELSYATAKYKIEKDELFKAISLVAPYQSLIEELSLQEALDFHDKMLGLQVDRSFIADLGLTKALNKEIYNFSSGMKQRLKLGFAFFSGRETIFLDEPTMNLDQEGVRWYQSLLASQKESKTFLIASNDPAEYQSADEVLSIVDFKKKV